MQTLTTPVLVIGAGAAGLRAAIELKASGVDCLVIGKRAHGDAHTRWAAGGINASLGTRDPEDSWQQHFADTIREGHFVCDPHAVALLCTDAPARVRELHAWGCPFSETGEGAIDQRYFGAQTFRRTCFVGDRTGEAIMEALVRRASEVDVPWRDDVFITRLLVPGGRVAGALGFDMDSGDALLFRASAVVLAAGGFTSAWDRSTSRRDENNGDAVALAARAGAVLRDMEFVQFHPTGMMEPVALRGRLVTEAVRGEGGRLFNADGERFMARYSPERLELDARDVVARAIYTEIREGRGTDAGAVLLDISHRDAAFIHERLPKVASVFAEHGIDMTRGPVQVAPTAHYAMGGVRVDFATGATSVPGLFAVGEATAGVHGANRLGGNSLAETVVFGKRTGEHVAHALPASPPDLPDDVVRAALQSLRRDEGGTDDPEELRDELGALLWEHAGIVRTRDGLEEGLQQLDRLAARARRAWSGTAGDPEFVASTELDFMIAAADAIMRCALLRTESRGAHHRSDHPDTDPAWQRTVLCRREASGELRLWTEPVPEVPSELQPFIAADADPQYHHLE